MCNFQKFPTYLHKLNPCLPAAKFPLCESWPLLLTLPNGFMKWNPVSLGAKYPQFQDLWVTWHMEKKPWFEWPFLFFAIFFVRNWHSLQSLQNRWIGVRIYIYDNMYIYISLVVSHVINWKKMTPLVVSMAAKGKMTADDVVGVAARDRYKLNNFRVPIENATVPWIPVISSLDERQLPELHGV